MNSIFNLDKSELTSNEIKIMFIFGTRPEAIKLAPVIKEASQTSGLNVKVCVTGQHRKMLDQVLDLFKIKPDYDLNIMIPNQTLANVCSSVLNGVFQLFSNFRPDCIVVHGDTTTTMAASIAAYYSSIPVAHIEAGLRTGDIYSPWPEEVNRKIVATIAKIHFAPTAAAKQNLVLENINADSIFVTGNTVIDAINHACQELDLYGENFKINDCHVKKNKKIILVTGHRRENFGEGFESICNALIELSKRTDINIIYPVHLNPNVQEPVMRILGGIENISLIPPLDYLPFVDLLRKSTLILTDSGGIQEEAPSLRKPVIVMRETTERPEVINSGGAVLVGTETENIVRTVNEILDNLTLYEKMANAGNPYGDGRSSKIIIQKLIDILK